MGILLYFVVIIFALSLPHNSADDSDLYLCNFNDIMYVCMYYARTWGNLVTSLFRYVHALRMRLCSNDWKSPSRIGQRTCTMLTNSIKSALAAIALQSRDCKLVRQLETQRKCSTCNNLKRRGRRAACS